MNDDGQGAERLDDDAEGFDSAVTAGMRFFDWVLTRDRLIRRVLTLAADQGLGEDEVRMLVTIGRHQHEDSDGPTGTTLATDLQISQPLASQHIGRLRDMGFVKTQPGLFDRRVQVARLTPAGMRMVTALFGQLRK